MPEAKRTRTVPTRRRRAERAAPPRRALDADILALNLEPVSFLVACEQPWTLEKVDAIELEYRCFLQLARDHPDEAIVPSHDCDTYWHAHILTLGLYLEHCEALFGAPLLHYPFSGRLGAEDAARQRERGRRSRRLQAELMKRVQATHNVTTTGADHEADIPEVPQPRRHAGAVPAA